MKASIGRGPIVLGVATSVEHDITMRTGINLIPGTDLTGTNGCGYPHPNQQGHALYSIGSANNSAIGIAKTFPAAIVPAFVHLQYLNQYSECVL